MTIRDESNDPTQVGGLDAVEQALAGALTAATQAGQWAVVQALAAELEARRKARQAPEIVNLDAERAKRGSQR